MTHAQCWAHTSRHFFEAKDVELETAARGLDFIGVAFTLWKNASASKKLVHVLVGKFGRPYDPAFFDTTDINLNLSNFRLSSPSRRWWADAYVAAAGERGVAPARGA